MSTLNQEAPPAAAPKGDIVKLEPFPRSDSFVLTLCAYNFIPQYPFKRKNKDTGAEEIKPDDAVEFYFGGIVDGKVYLAKTWPQKYSIHEKSNYAAAYSAMTGKMPAAGSKPSDLVGKFALVEVSVEEKTSRTGKKYTATNIDSIGKVPSILAGTGVDIKQLRPALDAALAGGDKDDGKPPF